MPKIIDLEAVKKSFDKKATESEKKSYDTKDTDEKKIEYLKKWNRKEKNKTADMPIVDISQKQEQTSVESFLNAAQKVCLKKKFTLKEIASIDEKIKEVIKKIQAAEAQATADEKEEKIKEFKAKKKAAETAAKKAATEVAAATAELEKLGVTAEVNEQQ